jgi:hypothetical protein
MAMEWRSQNARAFELIRRRKHETHAGRHAACKTGACTRALRLPTGVGRTVYVRSHCRASALAVRDGSYPAEVVVRSDGLAPYLGSLSAAHGRAKALRVLTPTFTTLVWHGLK